MLELAMPPPPLNKINTTLPKNKEDNHMYYGKINIINKKKMISITEIGLWEWPHSAQLFGSSNRVHTFCLFEILTIILNTKRGRPRITFSTIGEIRTAMLTITF